MHPITKLLTAAILILALLSAGCLKPDADGDGYADDVDDFPNDPRYHSDYDNDGYADEIDDLPNLYKYHIDSDGDGRADEIDAYPNDLRYKDDSDGDGYADKIDYYPDNTYAHEKSWWGDLNQKNGMYLYPVIIPPEGNLFNMEIKGIIQFPRSNSGQIEKEELTNFNLLKYSGYYTVWPEIRTQVGTRYGKPVYDNDEKNLEHSEYLHFDLYKELQPEQARALEDQYGYPESVVMEQADTDGDGALDKVAVRYEGSKGVLEFETEFIKGVTLKGYIRHNI